MARFERLRRPGPGPFYSVRLVRRASTAPAVAGIRARIVVPAPTGLSISSVPPSALTRSASPLSPEPRAGSTPPLPSSRTSTVVWSSAHRDPHVDPIASRRAWRRSSALRRRRSTRSSAPTTGASAAVEVELDRHRRAAGQGRKRGLQAAIGEDAGMDPASELAQLLECGIELGARGRELAASPRSPARDSTRDAGGSAQARRAAAGRRRGGRARCVAARRPRPRRSALARRPAAHAHPRSASAAVTSSAKLLILTSVPAGNACASSLVTMSAPQRRPAT